MVDSIQKAIFKPDHKSKLIHQGFSKKRHEPDPQIKCFPAKIYIWLKYPEFKFQMQPLEWLIAFKKPFLRLTHRSKLIHQGFSKMGHGPECKAGTTIGMVDGF